ncbi:MAG: ATP-binding protein [Planctomycetes bacterium]|nr:ATP-binding protein [Planctomycetota bacterium]
MVDYEKLGAFYLGREYDLARGERKPELLMYDAKDLTTHAVIVGMTGSGKTGLALGLLEEAAIDGIPAIAIDPKGDLGNLLLTFPELRGTDFEPWLDPLEAARLGQTPAAYAEATARRWREGLADWDQRPERIAKFRGAADVALYTPGSRTGLPLSMLRGFDAPPEAERGDDERLREQVQGAVAGLLALLRIEADPLRSREHILLAHLIEQAWRQGRNLDLGALIQEIQRPPFAKVGFVDLETFFPAADRFALAMQLNNLLAAPSFAAWLDGEALDVQKLLYTASGKARLSIISIAHLNESERMFVVTRLLHAVLAWARRQPGTASLRALLYMDEVYGYFPPVANPPSKTPMLTLLKQARAYGLGVVLATQNPVDLDYKGLGNAGTWFLGRLQTERDKQRVLEGLEGASAAAGADFDRAETERTLAGLGSRVFLMNNVHDDRPAIFQTRWTLSYLRGPLSREQIQALTAQRGAAAPAGTAPAAAVHAVEARPVLAPSIVQLFVPPRGFVPAGGRMEYRAALLGQARVRFVQAKEHVDAWQEVALRADAETVRTHEPWEAAVALDPVPDLEAEPAAGAGFTELPAALAQAANFKAFEGELREHLYRRHALTLHRCDALGEASQPGETEGAFRIRLAQKARERRDLELAKLRGIHAKDLEKLEKRLRAAQERVEREKSQYKQQTFQSVIGFGSGILGALFGRKIASAANVGRAASAARGIGRVSREREDVARAEESVADVQRELAEVEARCAEACAAVQETFDLDRLVLSSIEVKPRKADIAVERVALLWLPYFIDGQGLAKRAWE